MIRLRLLEDSDLDWVFQLIWHPKVHPWLFWDLTRPLRAGLGATLLEASPGTLSLAFALMAGSENVGFATLNHMHPIHRVATINYLALNPGLARGAGERALEALGRHGFEEMNLHKINSRAFGENRAMIALMRRFGIKQYGRAVQEVYRDGEYHDLIFFSMLRSEWEAKHAG